MIDRVAVLNKYNSCCAYCGGEIDIKTMEADHLIPVRSGRNDSPENLMPACRPCNRWKTAMPLEDFRKEIVLQLLRVPRDSAGYRMLIRYGLVKETGQPVRFYFEQLEAQLEGVPNG